jgi:hypothetical protein
LDQHRSGREGQCSSHPTDGRIKLLLNAAIDVHNSKSARAIGIDRGVAITSARILCDAQDAGKVVIQEAAACPA